MSNREIKVIFPGGKRVDAEYKGFTIKTDQPDYAGGEGSAPAPFDLFWSRSQPVAVSMHFLSAKKEVFQPKVRS